MNSKDLFENEQYPVTVKFNEYRHDDYSVVTEVEARDAVEVIIVNNGTLRILYDNNMYTAIAGQGFLINKNVSYRCTPVGNENCGAYSVLVGTQLLGENEFFNEKFVLPFTESSELDIVVLTEDNLRDENIIDGANKIIAANLVKKNGYELYTKGIMCFFWNAVLEYASSNSDVITGQNLPSADEVRVESALKYIAENYADQITLGDIANHIHISEGECCRCFKRVLMRTPFDYIMEYRIYQALKILYKNPKAAESINDLAILTGFNNISYFNKVFKKYTQITPTTFRKMVKNDLPKADSLYYRIQESVNDIV